MEDKRKTPRPLVKEPLGPSDTNGPSGGMWSNMHMGTTRAVTCEICGTNHPKRDTTDSSYVLGRFLGYQLVEECCGKIFDMAYEDMGNEFFNAKLYEIAEDPTALGHSFHIDRIRSSMKKAKKKLDEVGKKVSEIQEAIR